MTHGMHHLALPLGVVLATIGTIEPAGAEKWIASLGATGILAWWCWYTTTRTIPQRDEAYRKEIATEREHLKQRDEAYHTETAAERAHYRATIKGLTDSAERNVDKITGGWGDSMDKQLEVCRNLRAECQIRNQEGSKG